MALGDGDVGATVARRAQQTEADRIEGYDQQRAGLVGNLGGGLHVFDRAEKVWLLQDHTGGLIIYRRRQIVDIHLSAWRVDRDQIGTEVVEIGADRLAIFGMHAFHGDNLTVSTRGADRHQDRLGRGASPVVDAGVGNVHAGESSDQRLVFKCRLQIALANFCLIGRVRGIELAA